MSFLLRHLNERPVLANHQAGQRVSHPFRTNPVAGDTAELGQVDQRLAATLLRVGHVTAHGLIEALAEVKNGPAHRLRDVLLERNLVDDLKLYATLQRQTGLGRGDLEAPVDGALIDLLGAGFCLREQVVPLRRIGDETLVAAADPGSFVRHKARFADAFGKILPSLAPRAQIESAILAVRGPALALAAETTVDDRLSCRSYRKASPTTLRLIAAFGAALALLVFKPILAMLAAGAVLTLGLAAGLKLAALIASLRAPLAESPNPARLARLPTVSILVALYRESDIAARLVQRLGQLDYPSALLDVILVVEEEDKITRQALSQSDLPGWMRVVVTPDGRVKTKPRALNHALTQCKGTIIGVYDAEDAPAPDQIRNVVDRFAQRGPKVACLQGALDFYNPSKTWISRCFTLEYAGWFRVILPGLQRLGLPLPLGGTTLFFRRDVLETLGAWDAYNVTEDADLGIRLARFGYRTEILPSTTFEEANCRGLAWVKQRSRWVKGYMMTYVTHMRTPARLYRDLGAWGFWGFQVLFLGSIAQALLAPVLWSFWALCLGLGHPLSGSLGPGAMNGLTVFFMACEGLNMAVSFLGLKRSGQNISPFWVPTMLVYFPLQTFAAYKAAYEMLVKPFYWDKTPHGAFHMAPAFSASSTLPHRPAAASHRLSRYAL